MIRHGLSGLLTVIGFVHLVVGQTPFCSQPIQCGDLAAFSRNLKEVYVPAGPVVYEAAPPDTCSYGLPSLGVYASACAADVEPRLYCAEPNKVAVNRRGDPAALAVIRMIAYCMYTPTNTQAGPDSQDFYNTPYVIQ